MKRRTGKIIALSAALGGAALALVGPFLVPVPPLKGTLPPEALADLDSQFVEINGIKVHLKTRGEGKHTLVLLHGFASSLYSWDGVMDTFSQYGRVIAYDRVGFGLSERPLTWEGQNLYGTDAQLDLLIKLLDEFDVNKAILVGNSAGGTLAIEAALAYPERVMALVLVDAAVYNAGGPPAWFKPILASPQVRHLGPLISRQIMAMEPMLINRAWHNPAKLSKERRELYEKPTRVENWDKALWQFTLASRPADLTSRLNELTLPVLVVTGDDDRIVPTRESLRLAGELPNANLVVISEAGHVPHEEQPEAFMHAVEVFVKSLPG